MAPNTGIAPNLLMNSFLHFLASSTSFSMSPSKPSIFHGRESEMEHIRKILSQESPKIAILGGGGMGKTNLARAVLHHPDTSAKFEDRFFVSAESATTSIELAALIGLHVGLNPGTDLTQPVVQYLSRRSSCLLVLDNLETVWEPMQSRGGIEEFLALLTTLKHLALIVCPASGSFFVSLTSSRLRCEEQSSPAKSTGLTHSYCHSNLCLLKLHSKSLWRLQIMSIEKRRLCKSSNSQIICP
jgi:hypothetical protein